jgi:hypothetical protein
MHDEITAFFQIPPGMAVIFSWGDSIYNPTGAKISKELHAHEEIHSGRQGKYEADVRLWWRRYMSEPLFRYHEELPAHIAEYHAYCKRHGSGRVQFLDKVAERLASPLYGSIITYAAARDAIILGGAR